MLFLYFCNGLNSIIFLEGVEIIENAYQPNRSNWFIKALYENKAGIEVYLPLAISSIAFPEGFDLSFLIEENDSDH